MVFESEIHFERYIRTLIEEHICKYDPSIELLKSKKAVDILICKNRPTPELFFIEVKHFIKNHGRLGFGSRKGGGFQPEILSRRPEYFEKNLIIPDLKIDKLRQKSIRLVKESDMEKKELIKRVAELAREELSLKDNRNLMYVLESSGIYIIEKNLGSKIDAYSTVTTDGRSFIVLGTVKKSAARRNFDLSHELGHLLLHQNVDMDILTPAELRVIEKEAHLFASIFLLPEEDFTKDFMELKRKSNPDYYVDLKKKYLVSISALEMRAYGLGLMTYQENRYFWGQLAKKEYKLFEPLDDEITPVRPGKIRSLFKFVLDKKVIELPFILNEFNILPEFLSSLFSLDSHFFDMYLEVKKDYFSDTKIIDINSFRNNASFS